ncbi:FRG domain-containing protein [Chitinophaga sp. 22620]|uniref:FRG domain-containing protein n=1 Tax=Chitinophaga sp. 22620 TaxID=3453952 RepID=UPI003F83B066
MERYIVSGYDEIAQIIDDLRHPATVLQFRGQACDDCGWTLRPTLARQVATPQELVQHQRELMDDFQKRIQAAGLERRLLTNRSPRFHQADWELLQQAQHYEVPTMLMDFSLDWHRALYFAVHDPAMDAHDGQLWVYQAPYEVLKGDNEDDKDSDYFRQEPLACKDPIIANPAFYWNDDESEQIAAQRRWLQMGRFLLQSPEESLIPMEENPRFDRYLVKIVIPAVTKAGIRAQLTNNGLSMDYLYYRQDPAISAIVKNLKR